MRHDIRRQATMESNEMGDDLQELRDSTSSWRASPPSDRRNSPIKFKDDSFAEMSN